MAEKEDVIEARVLSSIVVVVGVVAIAYDYVHVEGSGLHASARCRWKVQGQVVGGVKDVPILYHRFVTTTVVERVKVEDGQGSWFLVQMGHAV